jgi:DNA-binding transcriptional LysR family regulator
MNLRELEYIVKIGECGNLASAAEALFITSSALSQHLSKVEDDLGTPLFYRSRGNWQPTPAGVEYMNTCRKILALKDETYRKIRDICDVRKGCLRIGMPPERAITIIRGVYPRFHKEYDGLTLNFSEINVRNQQKLIESGDLDLALVTLTDKEMDDNTYITLSREEVFLAVPADDPRCSDIPSTKKNPYPEIDLKLFDNAPFALMRPSSTLRPMQEDIFFKHHVTPRILFETSRTEITLAMVSEGICCSLIPNSYLCIDDSRFRYFSLPDHPKWGVHILYKKGRYLSKAEQRFIELTKEFWQGMIQS